MKKYWIITFGCQMNKSDSERIAASLEKQGYQMAKNLNGADLILVNMCSVRQSAVDRVFGVGQKLTELKTLNPGIETILTGCILKPDKRKFKDKFDSIVDKEKYLNFSPEYRNDLAYIPISNGCNFNCSYCVVPFTRSRLVCRSHSEIIKEVKKAVKEGVKELWLLGQNVNDYRSPENPKINFSKVLKMVDDLPGNFKFFFISPHPKNFSNEAIEVLASCQKFGRYLNLPLQSGDNKILKKMNRPYTITEYKTLVERIRNKIPGIRLSTDVIVGFPGETRKQFKNTVKLFKEIKFNWAYISKYSPRPGTAAFKMKGDIPLIEKKRREKILREILAKYATKLTDNRKLITILGQTTTGKSALAVKIAKKFNGEVISADSRQVYKGMNIGTGKISKKEMKGVPHHLLDVASPKNKFTVAQYQKLALRATYKIFKKGKVPILCGGTGFYIQAVIDGIVIPEVKPDWKLRKKIEKKTTAELFLQLKKLDPKRAAIIDKNNRRRLIRALEIVIKTKKPVPNFQKNPLPYPVLIIGIKKEKEELKKLIKKRLFKRLKAGMIKEVKNLQKSGVSWQRLEEFGLEYRYVAQYLQKKINYKKMIEILQKEIEHFAKRQKTWFKRDKIIHWIKKQPEAEKLVKDFLE